MLSDMMAGSLESATIHSVVDKKGADEPESDEMVGKGFWMQGQVLDRAKSKAPRAKKESKGEKGGKCGRA